MKERPIIFGAESVRQILAGKKTQSRRVVKDQASISDIAGGGIEPVYWWPRSDKSLLPCPYGAPGDQLFVKETWAYFGGDEYLYQKETQSLAFQATWEADRYRFDGEGMQCTDYVPGGRWRSPIFMPRWASRITLEITEVRVERLQDISDSDAVAEGVFCGDNRRYADYPGGETVPGWVRPIDSFRTHWDSINAKRGFGWERNPWVWVIRFKTIATTESDRG